MEHSCDSDFPRFQKGIGNITRGKKQVTSMGENGIKKQGFDREGPIPGGDFAENELMKLFQSGGVAVLDLIKNIRNRMGNRVKHRLLRYRF